jgi:SAM-dependent methyltransferase
MRCRGCGKELSLVLVDLGSAPPSNAYLSKEMLDEPETFYPLHVLVCESCWLVQTQDYAKAEELFKSDYAYYSSCSSSWLSHAREFVDEAVRRFRLNHESNVIEVASNDGYLLQYVNEKDIPCLGIEPTHSTASVAHKKGIDVIEQFFGSALAKRLADSGQYADLMIANNVLAHVPDINDFIEGFRILLKPDGVASFEFGYLLDVVAKVQFDVLYHEHYSYLSLSVVKGLFEKHGLRVFDARHLDTQGGSLRVFACRKESRMHPVCPMLGKIVSFEKDTGVMTKEYYNGFQDQVNRIKDGFLLYLLNLRKQGKKIIGYGAAAKGNTLLNYAGVKSDLVSFVVDKNPMKQGRYLPGSRIPIVDESKILSFKPDYIIIFPWNIQGEIMQQLSYVQEWGCRFIIAVPEMKIL